MNSDSFIVLRSDYPSGHPFQTQALVGSTTNEQIFQVSGAQNAQVGLWSQSAIVGSFTPMSPNVPGTLTIDQLGMNAGVRGGTRPGFTSSSFDGRAFRVRAMGKFVQQANTTNAQTVTFYLTQGNAVSSAKRIATVASTTNLASGSYNFLVEAMCMWDSGEQVVNGAYWGTLGPALTAQAALTNNVSVTTYTSLQFVCSAVFATSNATSSATLVEISMESV